MSTALSFELDEAKRRAVDVLRDGRRFLLVGHARPDGDCVGGQAALSRGLASLGKEVVILNPDAPAVEFDYLTSTGPFRVYQGEGLPEHDVCVLLDFNELSRCGALQAPLEAAPSKKLVIDHHPYAGTPWWDAAFVEVTASATGLLVWHVLHELGAPLDQVVAVAVFTSIVTDTGWFRYSNTDADTLAVSAELVRLGVDPARVFAAVYQRKPRGEPLALAGLLSRLRYFGNGRLAVVDQPLGDEATRGLTDSDPVLDVARSVEDVEVVLYVREHEPGVCKLSARSKTDFDVNALARRFGGGGHRKAAGATIQGDLADVRARLVEATLAALAGDHRRRSG